LIINEIIWRKRKWEFWNRLWEDLEIGYLDEDLLPILILFNLDKRIYTMSSCSGRITISDSTYPWSREETSVVFKKHEPISVEEIIPIYEKPVVRRLWFNVTGPIIHLSVNSLDYALEVLKIARNAGYKHSGILSINSSKGVLLELTTGIWMSQLLKTREKTIIEKDKLKELVDTGNEILRRGKEMLDRLYNVLRNRENYEADEEIKNDLIRRGFNKLSFTS
jgi:tRNA wybutosine-synthesizing protein 3